MKAVVIARYGGPEVVEYKDVPPPSPQDGELLVEVRAASVNPVDWQIRQGLVKLFIRPPFPAILGCDLAGKVVAVGRAVTRFRVGDEVLAMMPHDWGAQAELVAAPEATAVLKPATLSLIEAGAVGATAVTAVQALGDLAPVGPGMEVLINGASGGVGLCAVQVGKARGARVTAVCGAASFELVKGLGADELIDYRTQDFTRGPRRYDVIFDCIGNQPHHLCQRVMAPTGVHVTTMPGARTFLRWLGNPLFSRRVLPIIAQPTPERMAYVKRLLDEGRLKVVVDKVLPASAVVEAQAYSQSGRAKGKIVLTFPA